MAWSVRPAVQIEFTTQFSRQRQQRARTNIWDTKVDRNTTCQGRGRCWSTLSGMLGPKRSMSITQHAQGNAVRHWQQHRTAFPAPARIFSILDAVQKRHRWPHPEFTVRTFVDDGPMTAALTGPDWARHLIKVRSVSRCHRLLFQRDWGRQATEVHCPATPAAGPQQARDQLGAGRARDLCRRPPRLYVSCCRRAKGRKCLDIHCICDIHV